jgi:hypothetical protein
VLARLAPHHCNPTIHKRSTALPAATVASIKALAAVTGLSHVGELAVPCWHVFDPAPTLEATQAAVQLLTQPAGVVSVMSAGAGAAAAVGEQESSAAEAPDRQSSTAVGSAALQPVSRQLAAAHSCCRDDAIDTCNMQQHTTLPNATPIAW